MLYVADGVSGTVDPACDAHTLPMSMWALAHWQAWVPVSQLASAMNEAVDVMGLLPQNRLWANATTPARVLLVSLWRIRWTVHSHRYFTSDDGNSYDPLLDPPVVIIQAIQRSVRRWRFRSIGSKYPGLIPEAPDIDASASSPFSGMADVVIDFPGALESLLATRAKVQCKHFDLWQPKFKGH